LFEELLLGLNLGLILALILVLALRLLVDRFEGGCMGFPLNPSSLWKIELALDSFLDLQAARPVHSGPDTKNILVSSDAQNSPAKILTGITKLIADNRQEKFLPVSSANTLLQTDVPLPAPPILLVLPNRPNSFLEEMIVAHVRQNIRPAQVTVDAPKLFNGSKIRNLLRGLFIVLEFVSRRAVPNYPNILQWMGILLVNSSIIVGLFGSSNNLGDGQTLRQRRGRNCASTDTSSSIQTVPTWSLRGLEPKRAKGTSDPEIECGRRRFSCVCGWRRKRWIASIDIM